MKKGLLAESKPMRLPRSSFGRDQGWSRAIAVEPGPKLGPSSDPEEEERSQFEEEESTSRKDLRLRVILVRLP